MKEENDPEYAQLAYYTLSLQDPEFIHQYIVDAYAAQTADEHTKPIKLTFALVGLYLHLEKNDTGRQVQLAHMKLAKHKKQWPSFPLPKERGEVTITDVLQAEPGEKRNEAIKNWSKSIWEAYKDSHQSVADLLKKELFS